MKETHEQFQDVFLELNTLTSVEKMLFLEGLFFFFTISGRGIWSDEQATDAEKIEAYKWLNELLHRVWNIYFELRNKEENNFQSRLYENLKFYSDKSNLLRIQLVPTTLAAFNVFKERQKSNEHYN
jgi:hypothetical protein